MAKVRSWAGLDVHARSVLAVTLDAQSGELRSRRLPGETAKVVEFLATLPGPTRAAYEAGPTGYGLARALQAAGIGCLVAAPGKIERPAQDKVKTDQRDAERVLRLLMIDALHPVRVPTVEEEALRDLVRAGEDVRGDLMRARQRLSKLLLRHDILYEDTSSTWTQRHRAWLRAQDLGGGAQATLLDYLGAIDTLELRRGALEKTIAELVPASPCAQTVARLRCLRGVDTLSAVGLCAEIGDFGRFQRPGKLMSYIGLVPSENSSGETRRQGAITKTGSRHARRLSRPAGTTARPPPAASPSNAAKTGSPPTSSRSAGKPNNGCTASGAAWPRTAASAARSSRSPSPANSPGSAGHSPTPTDPPTPQRHVGREGRREPANAREHQRSKHEQPCGHARS
ncbi:MAG TPA: IS110 family transposase [Solirubrobacteraceae bacterium]|nr:IS110 family transposase [Solirubrobacteraceae bacterium]